jgi:hypothetical protein
MQELTKEHLMLAGEYAVASELCKRNAYAQITLGHHKSTDILLETENTVMKIQVKTKQGREWPGISGISRPSDYLILVDLEKKNENERPDFYILNVTDWKKFIEGEKEKFPGVEIDNKLRIKYPDGWKGLNLKPNQIESCKEKWDKIFTEISK